MSARFPKPSQFNHSARCPLTQLRGQACCVELGKAGILIRSSCAVYQASIVSKWQNCHMRDIVNRARELQQVGTQEVELPSRRSDSIIANLWYAVTISISVTIALSSICRTVLKSHCWGMDNICRFTGTTRQCGLKYHILISYHSATLLSFIMGFEYLVVYFLNWEPTLRAGLPSFICPRTRVQPSSICGSRSDGNA